MEEKSRAAAAAKQQRQQRQQQLLQQRRQVQVQQQPQQRPQQVTYQVVTQTPGGQTVLSPAPTGPTRYICVRPSGVQTTPAVGTVIARPTIQLVSEFVFLGVKCWVSRKPQGLQLTRFLLR